MDRRDVLKGVLALPALSLMGGCRRMFDADSSHRVRSGTKLAVILHGPFGVVTRKSKGYQATAFVPKTDADDPVHHEFRFRSPYKDPVTSCGPGYHFELLRQGLDIEDRQPVIDRGFDNINFSLNQWVPDPDNYFVMLDLPRPDFITYIPPLYPALFDSGHDLGGGRLGSVPLNHVLEYQVRDADDIRLRPKMKNCDLTQDYHPYSTQEMLAEYGAYHKRTRDQAEDPSLSQRPFIERWLSQYSHIFFLGVGLHPHMGADPIPNELMQEREAHGVRFFNNRLLPAIYQGQPIPPGTKLKKVGRDALPCDTGQSELSAPGVRPAAWQYSLPQPRLLTVSSTENCTSPGANGTVH